MTVAYAPSRDPLSKVRRRVTQWRAARPAQLCTSNAPILSICFDDFPASAANSARASWKPRRARHASTLPPALRSGWPLWTQFHSRDVRRLAAAGHEIGCHTYAHADCAAARRLRHAEGSRRQSRRAGRDGLCRATDAGLSVRRDQAGAEAGAAAALSGRARRSTRAQCRPQPISPNCAPSRCSAGAISARIRADAETRRAAQRLDDRLHPRCRRRAVALGHPLQRS